MSNKRYILRQKLPFLTLVCLLGFAQFILAGVGDVRINELMASNKNGIRDEDGDTSDWIEIYNSGSTEVDLSGWHLTSKTKNLAQWTFPNLILPSGGYLIVWASGKDRTNSTTALHTNFKLSQSGDFVGLSLADGTTLVSSITFPVQFEDVSYGCTTASHWGYASVPTPGSANSEIRLGFAPEVQFSVSSCTFQKSVTLALTVSDDNASIYYDLATNSDLAGSTNLPGLNSRKYVGPIQIAGSTLVRARAILSDTNYFPGPARAESYIQIADFVSQFSSSLPIIVLHNFGEGAIPDQTRQFAVMQVYEPTNGRCSLTNLPTLVSHTTIHRHGSSTLWDDKPNLSVETQTVSGENNNVALLGMPAENDWIFYGTDVFDKSALHNPVAHELYREMGHYAVRTRYAEVFIKSASGTAKPIIAADYSGLYVIEERVKIDKNRVAINRLYPGDTNSPNVTGGYLMCIDRNQVDESGNTVPQLNVAGVSANFIDPNYETITNCPSQLRFISNYLNSCYQAMYSANWTNPYTGYAPYIDMPSWIDYHLHQVFLFNVDMFRLSSFFYKLRGGKLVQGPVWDFDRSFGTGGFFDDDRAFNPNVWHSADGDNGFDSPWYSRLFNDPDFFQKWIDRYQELRMTVLSLSNLTAQIDFFAAQASEAAKRDSKRWIGMGQSDTSPRSGKISSNGFTYTFPTPGTYEGEVQFLKFWLTNRVHFMDTNFLAPPAFESDVRTIRYGDSVCLLTSTSESGTTTYYTLDGTDPRQAGGKVSSRALNGQTSINVILTNNLTVTARNWNSLHRNLTGTGNPPISSPWSGLTVASFKVAPVLKTVEILSHGQIHLVAVGVPTNACYLEVSTNLLNWQALDNNAGTNGQFEFVESVSNTEHFYRVWQ